MASSTSIERNDIPDSEWRSAHLRTSAEKSDIVFNTSGAVNVDPLGPLRIRIITLCRTYSYLCFHEGDFITVIGSKDQYPLDAEVMMLVSRYNS